MSPRRRTRALGAALLYLLIAGPACTTDVGDLRLRLVRSWDKGQDPFKDASFIRVRVDGPGGLVGPEVFPIGDHRAVLEGVPVGADRRITVEGLGPEKNVISRGRTGLLEIEAGETDATLYVGLINAFSYLPFQRLRSARAFHTATLLDDGSVLLCGGITTEWAPEGGSPPPRGTQGMERVQGNSLLAGAVSPGGCGGGASGCMAAPRVGHAATLLSSGNVLVSGGTDGKAPVDRVEVFLPAENRFVSGAALSAPRAWHHAPRIGEGVLIVGGTNGQSQALASELYAEGQLKPRPALLTGRRAFALTVLTDGSTVVSGGLDKDGAPLATVEVLAPGAPGWRLSSTKLTVPRAHHSATLLSDGTLLVAGGLTSLKGLGAGTGNIERLDLKAGRSTPLTRTLHGERWGHSATLLTDGRVLVVGGFSGNRYGPPSPAVEEIQFFEGEVVQVRPLANLREARGGHSATLLGSGMLLVAGGLSGSGPSQTAEVFVY